MAMSISTGPDRAVLRRLRAGFSLIEVTLSIGIVAFAFVAVFGLLPAGMSNFRQSMNITVGGQIAQRVINEAQQTDFDELVKDASGTAITGTNATGRKSLRYFDEQGVEVIPAAQTLTTDEARRVIYWVNTRVLPATNTPQTATTTLPSVNLATVTVEIANNPRNVSPALSTAASNDPTAPLRNLWSGATVTASSPPATSLLTRYTLVSRNK